MQYTTGTHCTLYWQEHYTDMNKMEKIILGSFKKKKKQKKALWFFSSHKLHRVPLKGNKYKRSGKCYLQWMDDDGSGYHIYDNLQNLQ